MPLPPRSPSGWTPKSSASSATRPAYRQPHPPEPPRQALQPDEHRHCPGPPNPGLVTTVILKGGTGRHLNGTTSTEPAPEPPAPPSAPPSHDSHPPLAA